MTLKHFFVAFSLLSVAACAGSDDRTGTTFGSKIVSGVAVDTPVSPGRARVIIGFGVDVADLEAVLAAKKNSGRRIEDTQRLPFEEASYTFKRINTATGFPFGTESGQTNRITIPFETRAAMTSSGVIRIAGGRSFLLDAMKSEDTAAPLNGETAYHIMDVTPGTYRFTTINMAVSGDLFLSKTVFDLIPSSITVSNSPQFQVLPGEVVYVGDYFMRPVAQYKDLDNAFTAPGSSDDEQAGSRIFGFGAVKTDYRFGDADALVTFAQTYPGMKVRKASR